MTKTPDTTVGSHELWVTIGKSKWLGLSILFFSFMSNLLMLAGPLYMLQVYDRVLPSRSVETLVALTALLVFAFVGMGIIDHVRGRIAARIGAMFQKHLEMRVLRASMELARINPRDPQATAAASDLDSVQRFLASPILLALCDVPWVPVFAALIFIFHPLLGCVALAGSIVLIGITLMNQWITRGPVGKAGMMGLRAEQLGTGLRAEMDTIRSLGMQESVSRRWAAVRSDAQDQSLRASDMTGGFSVSTKTFRLLLQSIMLGAGAWLVLGDQVGAGAMIASSILMGRALAPVETVIGQWSLASRARDGWHRLAGLLSAIPVTPAKTTLPHPTAHITIKDLSIYASDRNKPLLRNVNFEVAPGQAIGVIGASGSGKSSLARALAGLCVPTSGEIRLGGATLDQYDPDVLGSMIGYLPQRMVLFDGTISENISRLTSDADPVRIVRAAQRAGAHEMILTLPQGYDTLVTNTGGYLSGGQIQRIGLARALYGDPVYLVLDEPNSNLDSAGTSALNAAIRDTKAAGGAVFITAHRPSAIQECDMLLVLEMGVQKSFGPRDTVLRDMVKNHASIVRENVA